MVRLTSHQAVATELMLIDTWSSMLDTWAGDTAWTSDTCSSSRRMTAVSAAGGRTCVVRHGGTRSRPGTPALPPPPTSDRHTVQASYRPPARRPNHTHQGSHSVGPSLDVFCGGLACTGRGTEDWRQRRLGGGWVCSGGGQLARAATLLPMPRTCCCAAASKQGSQQHQEEFSRHVVGCRCGSAEHTRK